MTFVKDEQVTRRMKGRDEQEETQVFFFLIGISPKLRDILIQDKKWFIPLTYMVAEDETCVIKNDEFLLLFFLCMKNGYCLRVS